MPQNIERYVVTRTRGGWAVSLGADTLSEHPTLDEARGEARHLADSTCRTGGWAVVLDLTLPTDERPEDELRD